MAIDDLLNLAKGLLDGWNNGRLKRTLRRTAQEALDKSIEVAQLQEKLRQIEDEIRRLKGENPKPEIKPASTKELNPPPKKKHQKKSKNEEIEIDESVELEVPKEDLPKDAKFVGKRKIVIQEMMIKRRNIEFWINRYWSDELGRIIEAEVPAEFKGSQFGPMLRSFIIYQYFKNRVPHAKIRKNLQDWGIEISEGTINNILNDLPTEFADDLGSARRAAIKNCSQIHIDDTGAKFNGKNFHTFVVSNKFYTQYTTGSEKNRWSAAGAIMGGEQQFMINDTAVTFVARKLKKPEITNYLSKLKGDKIFLREEIEQLLRDAPFSRLAKQQQDIIRTGLAVGALRSKSAGPPIHFTISDDAPNFVDLTKNHQLCWVHEIRKYKLCEVFKRIESETLEKLVSEWRKFYGLLLKFKANCSAELRRKIREEFRRICSIKTLVKPLDEQLRRTWENRKSLLLFLKYPQLPLHNNQAELDIRERVIKRKISLQNRSLAGVKAWDLMLSLASTCRKLNLSFWNYLEDRISKRETIPYLGKLVNSL
jgi:hypothetical protein